MSVARSSRRPRVSDSTVIAVTPRRVGSRRPPLTCSDSKISSPKCSHRFAPLPARRGRRAACLAHRGALRGDAHARRAGTWTSSPRTRKSFDAGIWSWHESLPQARARLTAVEAAREAADAARTTTERHRTAVVDDLGHARLALGKLDGDLGVAAERLANAAQRRERAAQERGDSEVRLQQARIELSTAGEERARRRGGAPARPRRALRPGRGRAGRAAATLRAARCRAEDGAGAPSRPRNSCAPLKESGPRSMASSPRCATVRGRKTRTSPT